MRQTSFLLPKVFDMKPIQRCRVPRFFLPVVLLLIGALFAGQSMADDTDAMTVDALFEKHEAALAKTGRIKMRYKIREFQTESEYLWIESGEEKFLQPIEGSPNDRGATGQPTYFTHGGAVFSTYLDADHFTTFAPQSLAESLNSGHGFTCHHANLNWDLRSPRRLIFFSPVLGQQGSRSTLREAFFSSPWQSEPKKSTNDRGEVLWTVFSAAEPLTEEEMSLDRPEKGWTMVQFNQTKGFWVECFATFVPAMDTSEGHSPQVFSGCITEYKDTASGQAVPGKVIHSNSSPKGFQERRGRIETPAAWTVLEILEGTIDDDSIRVPEVPIRQYVKVFREDLQDPNGKEAEAFTPVSFWGKDDAPEVTFLSSEEKQYDEYVRQRYNVEQTPLPESGFSSIPLWRVVLLGVGILLVAAALVLRRRLSAA